MASSCAADRRIHTFSPSSRWTLGPAAESHHPGWGVLSHPPASTSPEQDWRSVDGQNWPDSPYKKIQKAGLVLPPWHIEIRVYVIWIFLESTSSERNEIRWNEIANPESIDTKWSHDAFKPLRSSSQSGQLKPGRQGTLGPCRTWVMSWHETRDGTASWVRSGPNYGQATVSWRVADSWLLLTAS